MNLSNTGTNRLAFDANSLNDLKRLARDQSPEAIKGASKQFEAMFMQMVMKSMREATPQSGLFESDQTKAYQQLLDQQLSSTLTQRSSMGLASVIEKQLSRQFAPHPAPAESGALELDPARGAGEAPSLPRNAGMQGVERYAAAAAAAAATAGKAAAASAVGGQNLPPGLAQLSAAKRAFVEKIWPDAVAVSKETGIPAHFMVAQAALETGWGKSEIRRGDGGGSFNLFNIKASGWKGAAAKVWTSEFRNGEMTREQASFRAYGSYAESFRDYAKLITGNARYAGAAGQVDAAGFARGLQQGGYATDPAYAKKLTSVINGLVSAGVVAGQA